MLIISGESQVLKEEANKNAFKKLETQMTVNQPQASSKNVENTPSERYDGNEYCLHIKSIYYFLF